MIDHTSLSNPAISYDEAFPGSAKVYVEGGFGVRVPMREISLSGGEPPLRVYDPSGPQGTDPIRGLPGLRATWIMERDVERVRDVVERRHRVAATGEQRGNGRDGEVVGLDGGELLPRHRGRDRRDRGVARGVRRRPLRAGAGRGPAGGRRQGARLRPRAGRRCS